MKTLKIEKGKLKALAKKLKESQDLLEDYNRWYLDAKKRFWDAAQEEYCSELHGASLNYVDLTIEVEEP